ncbi:MAG: mechanosensitive ion channel protein MscS [Flavobacteriales bacterium]|nr:MAG: mechanosensitive ion channel protein MscS [Flavobacteriales bacterium]
MNISEILSITFLGNTVEDYCWFLGMILLGFIFLKYLSKIFSNLLFKIIKRYSEGIDSKKFFELLHKPLAWLIMLIIIYTAGDHINYPEAWDLAPKGEFGIRMVIHRVYQAFLIGSVTWILMKVIEFIGLVMMKKAEKTESKTDDQFISFGVEALKIVTVIFTLFFAMGTIFNVNIGSLIAGLGIGGLALALAAKESLENLLGSFTIFFDKPFVVGDFVKVGDVSGVVEKVGFRSTRIRTLEKSYLTVPNKKMIDAELDNMTLRTFRRGRYTIGVTYNTSIEQIKAIVADIQQFIDQHPHTNQDGKVKFTEFGDSSLNILVQYYVDTMDWGVFLDVQQDINYKIMDIVKQHGSDFAFPSRTIYMEKGE